MATSISDKVVGTVQTVGAVTSTIITYAVPDNTVVVFSAYVVGRSTAGDSAGYAVVFTAKRHGGGAATAVGVIANLSTQFDAALTTASSDITVSGNNVIARVVGVAGLTIDW